MKASEKLVQTHKKKTAMKTQAGGSVQPSAIPVIRGGENAENVRKSREEPTGFGQKKKRDKLPIQGEMKTLENFARRPGWNKRNSREEKLP